MGVSVRPAVEADIPTILELGGMLHAESPRYREFSYSPKKVARLAMYVIGEGGALVAEKDGKIIGLIAGMVSEHWFSEDKIATDLTFFIVPEERKKGRAALMLVRAFEAWAESKGARHIVPGTSTQLDADGTARFYEKLGYERTGYQFAKRF